MKTRYTVDEKLEKAKIEIFVSHPFWATLMSKLKIIRDNNQPSMYTDGTILGLNEEFVEGLTPVLMTTALAHETTHNALGHPWRIGDRDLTIWQHACDYVVNLILEDAGFTPIPDFWLCDRRFAGMSAEEVYAILLKENGSGGGGHGHGQGGSGKGQGQQCCHPMPPAIAEHIPTLEAEWNVTVIQAAQAAKAMGNMPAFAKGLVDEIRKPKIDWRSELHKFMQQLAKNDYTWSRPNPRYISMGLYMPSMRSEEMGEIVFAGDYSGSCVHAVKPFASEMQGAVDMCRPERVHIMWWDTRVASHEVFERGEELDFTPHGGGGTAIADVFDTIEREGIQPVCLIILTDMAIFDLHSIAAPDYPVLWVSTTEGVLAPFGDLIFLNDVD